MPEQDPGWKQFRWVGIIGLLLFGLWLVPPGTLPYPRDVGGGLTAYGSNALYSDATIAHWPAAHFLRESVWQHRQLPLWSPDIMLGQPFSANPLNKVWYPPQWLSLIFPATLHLNIMLYLHLVLLVFGVIAWSGEEGFHPMAGGFALLAFGLDPRLYAHLGGGHLDIVYAFAWTPWLLWAMLRSLKNSWQRTTLELGIIAAMITLSDVRIALYILPTAALYGLTLVDDFRRIWRERLWLGWAGAVGLMMLLTAAQNLPLLVLGGGLTRSLIDIETAASLSLPLDQMIAGMLLLNPGGLHEWVVYCGIPVLMLAAAAPFWDEGRKRWQAIGMWGLVVFTLLWALGDQGFIYIPLVKALPFGTWLRVPPRMWVLARLLLIIMSVRSFDILLRGTHQKIARLLTVMVGFFGLLWTVGGLLLLPDLPISFHLSGVIFFTTGLGLWLAGYKRGVGKQRLVGQVLLLLTLGISLIFLDMSYIQNRRTEVIRAADQRLTTSITETDSGACDLVYSPDFALVGLSSEEAGIGTLHGVNPMQFIWTAEVIGEAVNLPMRTYDVSLPVGMPTLEIGERPEPDYEQLRWLGVRWIISTETLTDESLEFIGEFPDTPILFEPPTTVTLYSLEGEDDPRVLCVGGLRGTAKQRVEVCPESGITPASYVLPQSYTSGWRVWVDGERVEVYRAEQAFVGFDVPAGECHQIEIAYRPVADFIGIALSIFGCLVVVGLWWRVGNPRRA